MYVCIYIYTYVCLGIYIFPYVVVYMFPPLFMNDTQLVGARLEA